MQSTSSKNLALQCAGIPSPTAVCCW